MTLQLYNYFRSSSSYRVRIGLNLKGLDYTYLPVHLNRNGGEQFRPAFRALNPDAVVPVLVTENETLTQSLAILEWLEETHPAPSLLPYLAADRAWVRSLCLAIACEIHPLNNLRVLKYLTNTLKVSEDEKMQWIHHWIIDGFSAIEKTLSEQPSSGQYCFGNAPGLADCFLIPQVFNAQRFGIDIAQFEHISRINEACNLLKPFTDASPGRQIDAE